VSTRVEGPAAVVVDVCALQRSARTAPCCVQVPPHERAHLPPPGALPPARSLSPPVLTPLPGRCCGWGCATPPSTCGVNSRRAAGVCCGG
jgi:hypothetical protein